MKNDPEQKRRWKQQHPNYNKEWNEKHPDRVKAWTKKYTQKNVVRINQHNRDWRRKLKIEVISHYGGQCECCGENTIEFLTLDHPNNNGALHRKEIGRSSGHPYYSWLKKNNYPSGLVRVLCANCNFALASYGYCPHQNREE
jgi:hypothetical protein